MESRKGGCLLAPRYGPAGAGGQAAPPGVSWQMGRIMLKFRPIAPKPAAMAPAPPAATAAQVAAPGPVVRGKRKAVGGGGAGRRGRKPKKVAATPVPPSLPAVGVEKESEKEKSLSKSLSSRSSSSSAMTSVDSSPPSPPPPASQPATLTLMPVSTPAEKSEEPAAAPEAPARPAAALLHPAAAPSSWVTVEDVTSTWRDGEAPSAAAAASASACGANGDAPAFVSDQWGRVTWSNAAFSRAVSDNDDDRHGAASKVALAGALPAWGTCAGFTCRVRVRHAGARGSVVAPCDVWRLDAAGCYLWRLDLQAALTLGGLP